MPAAVVVRRVLGHGGKNWVTHTPVPGATLGAQGALPKYISFIAGRLRMDGHPTSEAIALAVAAVKRWAHGRTGVTSVTRARAAAALAEWEAKKAAAKARDLSNADEYDARRNALPGANPWVATPPDTADAARLRSNRVKVGTAARGKDPTALREKARAHAQLAEAARKRGDQSGYAHHAGIALGLLDAACADGLPPGVHLSNGGPVAIDLVGPKGYVHGWIFVGVPTGDLKRGDVIHSVSGSTVNVYRRAPTYRQRTTADPLRDELRMEGQSDAIARANKSRLVRSQLSAQYMRGGKPTVRDSAILDARYDVMHGAGAAARRRAVKLSNPLTDGMHVYDPKGDELDVARRTVRAIDAQRRRGATRQAQALEDSFVKAKTSRARKMPDGKVRSHTAGEVKAGLDRLRKTTNLSGGSMSAIDLAGSTKFLPDAAAVKKAAAKLGKLPPPLRKNLAARIAKRAKELGISVSLANQVRTAIDLSVDQATRDAARKAGLTFPGTTSYPLTGADGKFSRAMAEKAVRMVGLGNVASKARIRAWLVGKLKGNGCADLIPDSWPEAKS